MPSEMRRPGPIDIEVYIGALEIQLSDEAALVGRRSLPESLRRFIRTLRSLLEPTLQSGAVILTSLAVIVAVGVAPATTGAPTVSDTPLAAPPAAFVIESEGMQIRDNLPPGEFLSATADIATHQLADNLDMPPMGPE